jgi:hypothetical protein
LTRRRILITGNQNQLHHGKDGQTMTEQRPLTDTDEPIGTRTPEPETADESDVEGHGLLQADLHRSPATSRNAERPTHGGCRTPAREPHPRRGGR